MEPVHLLTNSLVFSDDAYAVVEMKVAAVGAFY